MRAQLTILIFAALVALPSLALAALSQEEAARAAAKLSNELHSPFCPGKTLTTCTSAAAFEVRQEIAAWYVQGRTTEDIMVELRGRYGEEIANPPQPWFTIVLPYTPLVLGAFVVFLFVRRNFMQRGESSVSAEPVSDAAHDDRLARLREQVAADDD